MQRCKTVDNGVYIAEAAPSNTFSQQIEAQLVDEGDVIKTLTVRLVRAIDQDVTVTLDIDQQLIDEYNQQHEASYELLPEEFRSFERTVTIPAGEVSAPVINLTIKPFTTPNNEAYAIPVRITSVAGPIGLVGNANHILYLLTSPNKQKAVVLKSANTFFSAICLFLLKIKTSCYSIHEPCEERYVISRKIPELPPPQ